METTRFTREIVHKDNDSEMQEVKKTWSESEKLEVSQQHMLSFLQRATEVEKHVQDGPVC